MNLNALFAIFLRCAFTILILTHTWAGFGQNKNKIIIDPETDQEMVIGALGLDELESLSGFENLMILEEYEGKPEKLEQLRSLLQGVEIQAYIGTWCEDSQYNFPQIISLLRQADYQIASIKIWGLDKEKKMMDGTAPPYQVEFVPSLIFLKNGEELGRFVEYPKDTFIDDFIKILAKK